MGSISRTGHASIVCGDINAAKWAKKKREKLYSMILKRDFGGHLLPIAFEAQLITTVWVENAPASSKRAQDIETRGGEKITREKYTHGCRRIVRSREELATIVICLYCIVLRTTRRKIYYYLRSEKKGSSTEYT